MPSTLCSLVAIAAPRTEPAVFFFERCVQEAPPKNSLKGCPVILWLMPELEPTVLANHLVADMFFYLKISIAVAVSPVVDFSRTQCCSGMPFSESFPLGEGGDVH